MELDVSASMKSLGHTQAFKSINSKNKNNPLFLIKVSKCPHSTTQNTLKINDEKKHVKTKGLHSIKTSEVTCRNHGVGDGMAEGNSHIDVAAKVLQELDFPLGEEQPALEGQ